jgi:hypothetical protein
MLPELTEAPGEGERWLRLAEWLRDQIDPSEVDGIWVFRVVRREQREYGTAVLSLVRGDRRRILTARYVATIKGRERGGYETRLDEVGSGPLEALHELLAMVPIRADDEDPPASVEPALWFPPQAEPTDIDGLDEVPGEDSAESMVMADQEESRDD